MARLFIALDMPESIREQIANICHGVHGARWVPQEQLHLTLRFLGDVPNNIADDIANILETVQSAPISLSLKGVGYFPPKKSPRVLWIGIAPCQELIGLYNAIQKALGSIGFEVERRKFHPHLTVARLRNDTDVYDVTPFLSANNLFETMPFEIEEFHIYSSILKPTGAVHCREASYPMDYYIPQ